MVERIDIERALLDLISNVEGFRFQGIAVALAQFHWPDLVACERQKDHGLDAYVSPQSAANGIGKGLSASITATIAKIKGDAETAQEHYGPFSVLIFATPQKVSKETEHKWAKDIKNSYGYELVVMSREDIIGLLQRPLHAWICRSHLRIPAPYQSSIEDTLACLRTAAKEEGDLWAQHARLGAWPLIQLAATQFKSDASESQEQGSAADLDSLLQQGRKVVLEAPAGRGKTTTLIRLAREHGVSGSARILVDLPGWIESGLDILEYVAQRPSFRSLGLDATTLARVFREEAPQFLLNGWNEVTAMLSEKAARNLRSLVRSYPGAGIIVATRAHHLTPSLPDAVKARLLPVSPDQRRTYLIGALGEARGSDLDSQLRVDPVLRELTTTPFILSGVATLVASSREIPRTRLGVIGAIVALAEQSDEHASSLQIDPLRGQAEEYLKALAAGMTEQGTVLVSDAEARNICAAVSGRLCSTANSPDILATLTAHHLLDRVAEPSISYRFAHQQFQEFYAALLFREALTHATAQSNLTATRSFAAQYLNCPSWQEPIFMVAEVLSLSSSDQAQGSLLVEAALGVDPVFAAELVRIVGVSVGGLVKTKVGSRLRFLYYASDERYNQLALAGMVATASAEFADLLMPLLTHPNQQIRLRTYRAGREFHPSCMGRNWPETVSNWSEELRAEFVSELALHHHQSDVALMFAKTDKSEKVRLAALEALIWTGKSDETIQFFEAMSDAEFAAALMGLSQQELPKALHARAVATYGELLRQADDPAVRMNYSIALAEFDDTDSPARLKVELDRLPDEVVKKLSDYALRPMLAKIQQLDSNWVSNWVARHIVDGVLWPDLWISFVSVVDALWLEQLLRRACTEDLQQTRGGGVFVIVQATATPTTAKTLFIELKNRHGGLSGRLDETESSIYRQIQKLICGLPPGIVIDGISQVLARPVDIGELTIVVDLFKPSGLTEATDLRSTISLEQQQILRSYLVAAVPAVLAQEDFRGEVKGYLSAALAEIGEPDDAEKLMELTRADLARAREGHAARARGERSSRAAGSPNSWSGWHVQALVRLLYRDSEQHLLELLGEPEYELDAAWGLAAIAQKVKPGRNAIVSARFGNAQPDYRLLGIDKAASKSVHLESPYRERYASALISRIDALLAQRSSAELLAGAMEWRLKELAAVLVILAPTEHVNRVFEIALFNSHVSGWQLLRLLETLVFAGVRLPTDQTFAVLEPVLQPFRTYGTSNDRHLLVRLLCLLPFTDDPERGVARLRDLLNQFPLLPQHERNLPMALAHCGHDAGLNLLSESMVANSPLFTHGAKEWIDAVSSCPLPRAADILLGFVDPAQRQQAQEPMISEYVIDTLAARIIDIARDSASVSQRIEELCSDPTSGQQRAILAKVVAGQGSERGLIAGLNLIADDSSNSIPYDLRKGIEDAVLQKRPYKDSNAYTLAPRAADRVKKRLFQILRNDPSRSGSAGRLLAQIEEWRLEYGRPPMEPRHPDPDSGEDWPPAVRQAIH